MPWTVEFTDKARKQLRKLSPDDQQRLLRFLRERIVNSADPRLQATRLSGQLSGYWRFRVGDYRIICEIRGDTLTVLVIAVGHRRLVVRHTRNDGWCATAVSAVRAASTADTAVAPVNSIVVVH